MPTSFAARSISRNQFDSLLTGKRGLGQFLRRVLKLDWGFSLGGLSGKTVQDGAQGVFEQVLGGASIVEEMCLGFDSLPMFDLFEPHRRTCSSFLREHHPALRHLTLHDVAVAEDGLIDDSQGEPRIADALRWSFRRWNSGMGGRRDRVRW